MYFLALKGGFKKISEILYFTKSNDNSDSDASLSD